MTAKPSLGFRVRVDANWRALRGVPEPIIDRICRDLDAGASIDARLLLADQLRAAGEHLRHLGAEAEANAFRLLADFVPLFDALHPGSSEDRHDT